MSERILIVEDEENLGLTLSERLKVEGFEVTWAQNAAEALIETQSRKFDLIILDVGLPDQSGFMIAERLRKNQVGSALIFLTAFSSPEDRIQGLELGAEDYITKPFHLKELLLRVQNGLRRSKYIRDAGDEVIIGRAKVYFSKLEVHVNETVFALTQKESALLKLLVDRKGLVVSRDEILNFVWSDHEYPTPRTIDNFVMKLRRIIELDPENPVIIKSIRGVGYQLVI